MCTLIDKAVTESFLEGDIVIRMESDVEIRFPICRNPRLAKGNSSQLNNIEISPFGIHWPDLDEDLSFKGLLAGNYGQHQKIKEVNKTAWRSAAIDLFSLASE